MVFKRGVKVLVRIHRVPELRGVIKSLSVVYEGERYYLVAIPDHHCSHVLCESDLSPDVVQGQLF